MYGVCNVFMGCGGGFVWVVPSFASWCAMSLPKIIICAMTFGILMLCLVHRI